MNTAKMRALLTERDGEKCAHCASTTALTIDHIVPGSKGGNDRPANLQLLCAPCNQRKDDSVDPATMTPERLRTVPRLRRRAKKPGAPGTPGSLHLPGCDSVYCMFGCPTFHGEVARDGHAPGERHPERMW